MKQQTFTITVEDVDENIVVFNAMYINKKFFCWSPITPHVTNEHSCFPVIQTLQESIFKHWRD